jgi:acetyl-CoA synthetase
MSCRTPACYLHTQWDEEHISYNFDVRKGPISVEYFKGGLTNICYNALDRHVAAGNGDRVCFLWEGNDLDQDRKMTYGEVLEEVCQLVSGPPSVHEVDVMYVVSVECNGR